MARYGSALIAVAILFHAGFPRYELHTVTGLVVSRFDRWTGKAETATALVDSVAWLGSPAPAAGTNAGPQPRDLFADKATSVPPTGEEVLTALLAAVQTPDVQQSLRSKGIDPALVERRLRALVIAERLKQK